MGVEDRGQQIRAALARAHFFMETVEPFARGVRNEALERDGVEKSCGSSGCQCYLSRSDHGVDVTWAEHPYGHTLRALTAAAASDWLYGLEGPAVLPAKMTA